MTPPTVADLAAFMRRSTPSEGVELDAMTQCLAVAVDLATARLGSLDVRTTGVAAITEAILIIAKHEYGVRLNPSVQAAPGANGEFVPGPSGYMIPNRAASLLDAVRFDHVNGVGIG